MNEELLKKYTELMEKGTILTGRITSTKYDSTLDTNILMLDVDGTKAIITREELDVREIKTSLVNYVGKKIKFMIIEIDKDAEVLICSRKAVKEIERDVMIERLQSGEEIEAKIVKLLPFGAYLDLEGTVAVIRNQDFANDFTTIADKYKVGDTMKVKQRKISSTKKVFVEAVDKFTNPTKVDLNEFEPDQVVFGIVRNVKTWGCYVCIAPNLDALCPVPPTIDIDEGLKVSFRIMNVDVEKGHVRGKILKVISNEEE